MNTPVYYIIAGGFLVCTLAFFALGILLAAQKNPGCILPFLISVFIFTVFFVPIVTGDYSAMDAFSKIMEYGLALGIVGVLYAVFLSPIVLLVILAVALVFFIIR